METGQIILTILLLVILIALGFSYSEEVSSNRRLLAQLRNESPDPGLVARMRELYKDIDELRNFNREAEEKIEALERTIALKDETIKNLNSDRAKLNFDYAAEVAGRNERRTLKSDADNLCTPEEAFDEIMREAKPFRGEWMDESTYLNPDQE